MSIEEYVAYPDGFYRPHCFLSRIEINEMQFE